MAGPSFDIQGARDAGYSDAEIVSHLADKNTFDVKGAEKAGYSSTEILTHLTGGEPKSTSFMDAAKQGAANVIGGVGETLKQYGPDGSGDRLNTVAKTIAPTNYAQAEPLGKDGFSPSAIPRAVVEAAPSMVGPIAAARLMPGPLWAKALAGGGAYALQSLGQRAQQRADAQTGKPDSVPTTGDKLEAAAAMVPEAAVGTLGLSRFLPGVGNITATGAAGLAQSARRLATTVAAEGASTGAQNVVAQTGRTIGTPGGLSVDPLEAGNAAIVGGATGGGLATGRFVGDVSNAKKYSAITPELHDAATQVANQMKAAAGARTMDAGVFSGTGAQKTGADVLARVKSNVGTELADARKALTNTLPSPSSDILDNAASGRPPTKADYATLTRDLAGDPNADAVLNAVQKTHVLKIVGDSGDLSDGKLSGGLSSHLESPLTTKNVAKTAAASAAAHMGFLGETGAHLIAYSPEVLAALAAAGGLARLSDSVTGARSPAGRFANFFETKAGAPAPANVPPAFPAATAPPAGPWGPRAAPPTVPNVAQPATGLTAPPAGLSTLLQSYVAQKNREGRKQDQQTKLQAMPLLAKLAAQQKVNELPAGFASMISNPGAKEAPPAAVTTVPGTSGVPKDVMTNAKALVSALRTVNKIKTANEGANDANDAVKSSPYLDQLLGGDNVPTPAAGAAMSKALSASRALAKLRSDPEAQAAEAAAEKATKVPATEGPPVITPDLIAQAHAAMVPPPPPVVKITKSADGVHEKADAHGEVWRVSPYAHLSPRDAALAATKDATAKAPWMVTHQGKYANGVEEKITKIRSAAATVASEVPGADAQFIAERMEYPRNQRDAMAKRDRLAHSYPELSNALNNYFSDGAIARIWATKK